MTIAAMAIDEKAVLSRRLHLLVDLSLSYAGGADCSIGSIDAFQPQNIDVANVVGWSLLDQTRSIR